MLYISAFIFQFLCCIYQFYIPAFMLYISAFIFQLLCCIYQLLCCKYKFLYISFYFVHISFYISAFMLHISAFVLYMLCLSSTASSSIDQSVKWRQRSATSSTRTTPPRRSPSRWPRTTTSRALKADRTPVAWAGVSCERPGKWIPTMVTLPTRGKLCSERKTFSLLKKLSARIGKGCYGNAGTEFHFNRVVYAFVCHALLLMDLRPSATCATNSVDHLADCSRSIKIPHSLLNLPSTPNHKKKIAKTSGETARSAGFSVSRWFGPDLHESVLCLRQRSQT